MIDDEQVEQLRQHYHDGLDKKDAEIERQQACINELFEAIGEHKGEIERLRAERDKLLAALKPMVAHFSVGGTGGKPIGDMLAKARAAIAKAEGK